MRLTDGSRFARATLAADLIALPAFVVVGMSSHRTGSAIVIFARTAVPVVIAWLVVARVFGTYRPPSFTMLIATWAVGVPVGILVRAVITSQLGDDDLWVFLGVAMAFTLLFLGVGRALAMVLTRPWKVS